MFTFKLKKESSSTLLTYVLAFFCGILIVVLAYFFFFQKISSFELSFAEYSHVLGENAGSVIPASCNSSPPDNHFAGDCPPVVETTIIAGPNTLVLSGVNVTPNLGAVGGYQYLAGGGLLNYSTSGGVTRCLLIYPGYDGVAGSTGDTSWIGTNGPIGISGAYQVYSSWQIRCTNGAHWTPIQTVYVYETVAPYSIVNEYSPPS